MKAIIKKIGDLIIDSLFDFDKNEYGYESACSEPYNGVYEPAVATLSTVVNFCGRNIDCSIREYKNKRDYVEAIFSDKTYANIEEALEKYINDNIPVGEFFSVVEDDMRGQDEFDSNGFANESDYNRYRYSIL